VGYPPTPVRGFQLPLTLFILSEAKDLCILFATSERPSTDRVSDPTDRADSARSRPCDFIEDRGLSRPPSRSTST